MSSIGDDSISAMVKPHDNHQGKELVEHESKFSPSEDSSRVVGSVPNIGSLNLDEEINNLLDNHDDVSGSNTNIISTRSNTLHNLLPELDLANLDHESGNTVTGAHNNNHEDEEPRTVSNSQSPSLQPTDASKPVSLIQQAIRQKSNLVSVTSDGTDGSQNHDEGNHHSRVSAYARLDFENFTFFVQTLQVVLGRKSNDELLQTSHHSVDIHLSSKKAISRRHAKIFYNFGTQRFEISILGRNGAFVDEVFVEKGLTIPLKDGTKIQIGDIPFEFVLPSIEPSEEDETKLNPSDVINLRSAIFNKKSPSPQPLPHPPPSEKSKSSPKKDAKIKLEDVKNDDLFKQPTKPAERKNSISRRDSILKIRRLSTTRRKSQAANDEINELLKDLGVTSIDALAEENSDLLDAQIQSLLAEADADVDAEVDTDMREYDESPIIDDEEDEITKLENNEINDIEMNLTVLDQEIASLAPLIDAHNQELMKEKEEKKKVLEKEKKKKQQQQLQRRRSSMVKSTVTSGILANSDSSPSSTTTPRSAPLMGKPASIQPPASRLYNRTIINGITSTSTTDGKSPAFAATSPTYVPKQIIPPRPPPPKLEVPVLLITSEPAATRSRLPLRAITVSDSSYLATFDVPKTIEEPSKYPKQKLRKDIPRKPAKKVYSQDEIPEQHRSKPNVTFMMIITSVLKTEAARNGLTINEITEAIKEIYPYYKYCQDGWQFSISHCIKFNKIYKRLMKRGTEWLFTMDDLYMNEREKARKKQQEIAAARAKAEAARQEELRQKQKLEAQQAMSQNLAARNFNSPYGIPNARFSQNQFVSQSPYNKQLPISDGQKPKTIAELASEIRRDGVGSKAPMYFKPTTTSPPIATTPGANTIKAQLAANRASSPTPSMSDPNTQKSLEYLRKELFVLYRGRKLTYDKQTATVLITKALATTIAQVNSIGAKAGCGENALGFLVERAPEQVSKILDIALTKSIKEHEGTYTNTNSRATTPVPTPSPSKPETNTSIAATTTTQIPPAVSSPSKPVSPPVAVKLEQPQAKAITTPPIIGTDNPVKAVVDAAAAAARNETKPVSQQSPVISKASVASTPTTTPQPSSATSSPPVSTSPSLAKPPSFVSSKPKGDSLGRPSALGRPQSFGKPGSSGALSRPPTFLSNKPAFRSNETEQGVKRELEGSSVDEQAKKVQRTE